MKNNIYYIFITLFIFSVYSCTLKQAKDQNKYKKNRIITLNDEERNKIVGTRLHFTKRIAYLKNGTIKKLKVNTEVVYNKEIFDAYSNSNEINNSAYTCYVKNISIVDSGIIINEKLKNIIFIKKDLSEITILFNYDKSKIIKIVFNN